MDIITRNPRIDETSALRRIWRVAFGDGDESAFFSYCYKPEMCLVAELNGMPVSAGYLLPAGRLKHDGQSLKCAMLYGVASLPECRGRGFGTAVVRDLGAMGRGAGFDAVVLCPADDSLFEYYSDRTAFRDWFYVRERRLKVPSGRKRVNLTEITAQEYSFLREKFLVGITHIEMDLDALSYQCLLCSKSGGGLFKADISGKTACAVVEKQPDGKVLIKELLAPDGYEDRVIAAIAAEFPAEEYIIRSPACSFERDYRRFGMLVAFTFSMDCKEQSRTLPWYGLAFD